MTNKEANEEAIKILSYNTNLGYGIIIEAMEGYTTRDIKIALDMAIKALQERPQGECKCVTCKYCSCEITEMPCRECSHSHIDLYEEADMGKGGADNG